MHDGNQKDYVFILKVSCLITIFSQNIMQIVTIKLQHSSSNSFCCIYLQRNQNLLLFNWCLVPMAIQDIRHLEGCLWEYSIKANMKNFATSPCYHVIIMYVCLGTCTYWLTVHVVIVYDCLDVLHAAVTHFNFIFCWIFW